MILIGNFGTVPDEFDVFIAIPILHHFPEIFDLLLSTEKECIDGNKKCIHVYLVTPVAGIFAHTFVISVIEIMF